MKSFLRQLDEAFTRYESVNENHLGVSESNYIEVAIRDARLALEIYADIARNYNDIVLYGSNVYASNNAEELSDLLSIFDKEAIEISEEQIDTDLDEQNVTGAVAGFATPNAFRKTVKHVGYASGVEESVNVRPSHKIGEHQRPESMEETAQDKFPFSSDLKKWPNNKQEYPVKFTNNPYGTANIEDNTQKVSLVAEAMDRKYEQIIEGYRNFANGDPKISPEKKVNQSIKEVAQKLKEIEETILHTTRLKTESGIAHNGLKQSSKKALNKISERLIKISERVRSLGE